MASSNVKITILASEWGASWEEPWTIIRELAIQLAKSSGVDITFFVPQCSDEDKKEALRHKVHILKATPLVGFEELEWLSFPPQHLKIDIIIGHGVKLGRQAQVIKNSHKCKWVQVVHSHPEELGMFKSYPNPITTGEEKNSVEMELCKIADFVVGVGPKLSEAFRNYLRRFKKDKPIFDLTPGVFNEFINVNLAPEERTHRSVLVFGRGDAEDFELKGFDIAARAVAALPDTHLVFFEESKGNLEEVERRFLHCGVPANRLRVRSYDKNQESLKGSFRKVHLVLMPSRTDGFGLSGLVALSAGIPVLVSKNSGLGEALSKVPFTGSSSFVIDSEDPERWAAAIKALWKKDPQSRLEKAEALRSYYMSKYSWSKQSDALLFQMMNLVKEVSEILFAEAPYSSPDLRYAGFVGEADALSHTRRQMGALLLQKRNRPLQGSKSRPGEYSGPAVRYAGTVPIITDQFIRRPELRRAASAQQLLGVDVGNSDDDEKKDEEEVDDGNGRNVGEEVTEGGEQLSQQLHEVQREKQQHLVEEEANKIRVYKGQVTSKGTHLDLKLGAVHLTFPPDAVSEPTSIVVHKWKSRACSPQLQEHEAIVSNVIEISTTTNKALQFKVGVKLVFSHCAPHLQGYELVIKRLISKETNDWKEVKGTVDARQLSDIEDEYPKEVPDFSFPVVQADITECSIYTVICRLKPSPTYTISSSGGCFNHPDYPGVAVRVPKKAVSVKSKISMELKIQKLFISCHG